METTCTMLLLLAYAGAVMIPLKRHEPPVQEMKPKRTYRRRQVQPQVPMIAMMPMNPAGQGYNFGQYGPQGEPGEADGDMDGDGITINGEHYASV